MWAQRPNDDGGIIGTGGTEVGDEQSPWGPAGNQAFDPFLGPDFDMNAYAEMSSQAFGPPYQVNSNMNLFLAVPHGSAEGTEEPRADCNPEGLFGSDSGQEHRNNVGATTVQSSSCIAPQAANTERRQGLTAPEAVEPELVGWNSQPSDGCNPSRTSTKTRPPTGQTRSASGYIGKPYECEYCQRGFQSNRALRRHRLKKHGASEYLCAAPLCERSKETKGYQKKTWHLKHQSKCEHLTQGRISPTQQGRTHKTSAVKHGTSTLLVKDESKKSKGPRTSNSTQGRSLKTA